MPTAGPTVVRVGRLRVYEEPAGSFAIDHTGTLGDFIDVPYVESSDAVLTFPPRFQDTEHAVQDERDYREEIEGPKKWQLQFTVNVAPTGTAAGDGVAAVQGPLGRLLKVIWGGEQLDTGSTINGTWANSASGDVAVGSNFTVGAKIGVPDSSGVVHYRKIESISSNTVTVSVGFGFAPASGATAYGTATYYHAQDPDSSLQFIVEGPEAQDRWVLLGGQGSVTFNLPLDGSIQQATFNIEGVDYLQGDDAAGAGTIEGGALSNASYPSTDPIPGHVGRFLSRTNGVATFAGATVDVQAVTWEPRIPYEPVTSPTGVQGVLRWRRRREVDTSCAGSFTTYYTSFAGQDNYELRHDLHLQYQVGVTAGRVYAFDAGTVQITDWQRVDQGGIRSETRTWKARLDGDTSGGSGDLPTSPFRLSLG